MKDKISKLGYHGIFTMMIIILSMLLPFGTEYLLMACTLVWIIVHSAAVIRGQGSMRKKYHRMDLLILIFLVYEILHMICRMIWVDEEKGIDFTLNILFMSLALLYFLCAETKAFYQAYLDAIVYGGLIVMGALLYFYICDMSAAFLLAGLTEDTAGLAAFLVLTGMVSVLQYCRCSNIMQKWFYGVSAGLSFFLLLVNHNRVSLWLMVFFFMLVPVCIRPTAELVKRDMQMFLLYAVMSCNMSLLSNYTDLLLVEISYDLEQSVYMELLLAAGALVFFHYWDRIPEGAALDRVVLRRLFRCYRYVAAVMICLFLFILFSSNGWNALAENGGIKFLRNLAIPLCDEINQGRSFLYLCMEEQGIPVLVGMLLLFVSMIIRMRKNIGWDKPMTAGLYLITIFGMVQCFFWNPSAKALPVYLILAVGAMNYQEERSRFVGIKVKDLAQLEKRLKKQPE